MFLTLSSSVALISFQNRQYIITRRGVKNNLWLNITNTFSTFSYMHLQSRSGYLFPSTVCGPDMYWCTCEIYLLSISLRTVNNHGRVMPECSASDVMNIKKTLIGSKVSMVFNSRDLDSLLLLLLLLWIIIIIIINIMGNLN